MGYEFKLTLNGRPLLQSKVGHRDPSLLEFRLGMFIEAVAGMLREKKYRPTDEWKIVIVEAGGPVLSEVQTTPSQIQVPEIARTYRLGLLERGGIHER